MRAAACGAGHRARVREESGVDRNVPQSKIGLANQTRSIRPVYLHDWLKRADTFFSLPEKNLLDGALTALVVSGVTAGSESYAGIRAIDTTSASVELGSRCSLVRLRRTRVERAEPGDGDQRALPRLPMTEM